MSRSESSTWLTVGILAVSAYVLYFFSFDLLNSPTTGAWGNRTSRLMIGFVSVPGFAGEAGTPVSHAFRQLRHVRNMSQRVSLIGYAILVLLAFGGIGDLLLRFARKLCGFGDARSGRAPPQFEPLEHSVFAFGVGTTSASLGMLLLGLNGWLYRPLILAIVVASAGWCVSIAFTNVNRRLKEERLSLSKWSLQNLWNSVRFNLLTVAGVFSASSFLLLSLLGSLLPATDFDVLTYHLQGPKEYYLSGRISFAPHNVYMNMPFGTEMISLMAMKVVGDWWWGGLVGQTVLSAYAPMTALGIAQLGKRCFGSTAGWLGALIYLTTPWVYRISIIPLTENALAFYLLAATLAAYRAVGESDQRSQLWNWLLAGFLAGSAAACKYTAIVSTVGPIILGSLFLHVMQHRRAFRKRSKATSKRSWLGIAAVILGVFLAFGPWMIRNSAWTGNPTYPLLYKIFGGRNWTAEKNQKWEWGHRVALLVALGAQQPPADRVYDHQDPQHSITTQQFVDHLKDVVVQSDWLSPLLFSLAPFALIGYRGRRSARWLWLLVGFLFLQWWLLTHRNDRFWTAMLPIVALLAGGGCVWTNKPSWRWFLIFLFPPIIWFNLSFSSTSLCGYNQFGKELIRGRHPFDDTAHWLSDRLPASARVLAVGEAAFFHQDRTIIYNTVFDDSIFLHWTFGQPADQILDELRRRQVTHVFVNWDKIRHYRSPRGYGFPDQITPSYFQKLKDRGILKQLPFDPADAADPVTISGHTVSSREIYEVIDRE